MGLVNKRLFIFFFGKAHKSKRICEVLFDVAKCKRKRKKNQIEKEREPCMKKKIEKREQSVAAF